MNKIIRKKNKTTKTTQNIEKIIKNHEKIIRKSTENHQKIIKNHEKSREIETSEATKSRKSREIKTSEILEIKEI